MNIQEKIEHIRRQPEAVRMRYVLGSVSISMFFIILLWIFSLTTSFQRQEISTPDFIIPIITPTNPNDPAALGVPAFTTHRGDTVQNEGSGEDGTPSLNEWIKK
jgi:hypothetical protein